MKTIKIMLPDARKKTFCKASKKYRDKLKSSKGITGSGTKRYSINLDSKLVFVGWQDRVREFLSSLKV